MLKIPEPSLEEPVTIEHEWERWYEEVPVITSQTIENLEDTLCSDLCRYPYEYKDSDELWNAKCDQCELIAFMERIRERV